jgi:Uma2 family endonuclease
MATATFHQQASRTRAAPTGPAALAAPPTVYRFSVEQYHRMIAAGVFSSEDRAELLDGWIVFKLPQNPAHAWTIQKAEERIGRVLPGGWCVRAQLPITLDGSEPEPDVAVCRGSRSDYAQRHPTSAEIGALVEISDPTLQQDRAWKAGVYAAAGIPICWIINLVDDSVEVYVDPTGPNPAPAYLQQQTCRRDDSVPLMLVGRPAILIPVDDLLP